VRPKASGGVSWLVCNALGLRIDQNGQPQPLGARGQRKAGSDQVRAGRPSPARSRRTPSPTMTRPLKRSCQTRKRGLRPSQAPTAPLASATEPCTTSPVAFSVSPRTRSCAATEPRRGDKLRQEGEHEQERLGVGQSLISPPRTALSADERPLAAGPMPFPCLDHSSLTPSPIR
jgi:hypothetical protein